MGISSDRIDEKNTKHAPQIPESSIDKIYNSIVRINNDINDNIGTGFFMKSKINEEQIHFLLTCYHVISEELISEMATISISYGKKNEETTKKITLDKNQRFIRSFEPPIDAIIIEINDNDNIPDDKYLLPDLNYKNGYDFYEGKGFFLAGYPAGENGERCISSGQIKSIDNYEFQHSLDTRAGSSGSPICLIDNKCIIGIHKQGDKEKPINYGIFIGYILDELEKKENDKKDFYTILPENEKSDFKRCSICGEIYQVLDYFIRQGDAKEVPSWRIIGMSGIKKPKQGIQTCVNNGFSYNWRPWIWDLNELDDDDLGFYEVILNCISHYDDNALEEIEKGNCIMENCNGKLAFIKIKKENNKN